LARNLCKEIWEGTPEGQLWLERSAAGVRLVPGRVQEWERNEEGASGVDGRPPCGGRLLLDLSLPLDVLLLLDHPNRYRFG